MDSEIRNNNNLSRRQFLAQTGAAVAGMSIAGKLLADDNTKIILGEGDHKYECIHNWLTPPDNILWGDTQGVAQDSKGNIYISHTVHPDSKTKDAIVVFDRKGKFLSSWGSRFNGGGHGLDIRKEGKQEFLYHCDTAHRQVVKTDLTGTVIWEKGIPLETGVYEKDGKQIPFVPTNVALAPKGGDFYVTDGYGSDYIMQYNIKGELIRTFGGKGEFFQAWGATDVAEARKLIPSHVSSMRTCGCLRSASANCGVATPSAMKTTPAHSA